MLNHSKDSNSLKRVPLKKSERLLLSTLENSLAQAYKACHADDPASSLANCLSAIGKNSYLKNIDVNLFANNDLIDNKNFSLDALFTYVHCDPLKLIQLWYQCYVVITNADTKFNINADLLKDNAQCGLGYLRYLLKRIEQSLSYSNVQEDLKQLLENRFITQSKQSHSINDENQKAIQSSQITPQNNRTIETSFLQTLDNLLNILKEKAPSFDEIANHKYSQPFDNINRILKLAYVAIVNALLDARNQQGRFETAIQDVNDLLVQLENYAKDFHVLKLLSLNQKQSNDAQMIEKFLNFVKIIIKNLQSKLPKKIEETFVELNNQTQEEFQSLLQLEFEGKDNTPARSKNYQSFVHQGFKLANNNNDTSTSSTQPDFIEILKQMPDNIPDWQIVACSEGYHSRLTLENQRFPKNNIKWYTKKTRDPDNQMVIQQSKEAFDFVLSSALIPNSKDNQSSSSKEDINIRKLREAKAVYALCLDCIDHSDFKVSNVQVNLFQKAAACRYAIKTIEQRKTKGLLSREFYQGFTQTMQGYLGRVYDHLYFNESTLFEGQPASTIIENSLARIKPENSRFTNLNDSEKATWQQVYDELNSPNGNPLITKETLQSQQTKINRIIKNERPSIFNLFRWGERKRYQALQQEAATYFLLKKFQHGYIDEPILINRLMDLNEHSKQSSTQVGKLRDYFIHRYQESFYESENYLINTNSGRLITPTETSEKINAKTPGQHHKSHLTNLTALTHFAKSPQHINKGSINNCVNNEIKIARCGR